MVAIKALTLLALTGATLAVPVTEVGEALVRRDAEPQGPWGGWRANYSWRYGWGRPQGQASGQGQEQAQPQSEPQSQPTETQSQPEPQAQPEQSTPSQAAESAAPSTPASSGGSSDGSYMGIVNEWRGKMGLPSLTEDNTLQSNALQTSDDSGGQLKHHLFPGSMAQVMAPGSFSNFESIFVGGWLCELPSLPGLGSAVCNSASQGWNHAGQTGHAEILSSTKYTKIGCGVAEGICTCDLA